MSSYCLKCRNNTKIKNPKFAGTNNGRTMRLPNCAVCDSWKIKMYLRARELFSSFGIKTLLIKISSVGPLLL